jgi:predicted cation transporter
MNYINMVDTAAIILTVTFLIILLAPLLSKKVEENLEVFF